MSLFTVPEGMSCVNAFRALYESGKPVKTYMRPPISTPEKVADLFKNRTSFYSHGERHIKADFSKFPVVDATSYDSDFFPGAAQMAVMKYNLIPSDQRFDKYDSYKFNELINKS